MTAAQEPLALGWRKKPVVVQAVQFDGTLASVEALHIPEASQDLGSRTLQIPTLEGVMTAQPGDWIIRGVQGEFYPCKPDIFAATYEPAGAREPDHLYNQDDWEYTVPWAERGDILSDEIEDHGGVVRYRTLYEGDDVFAANVPVEFDDDGCPVRFEIQWFDSKAAAEAALADRSTE